jgi:hypothetical protein
MAALNIKTAALESQKSKPQKFMIQKPYRQQSVGVLDGRKVKLCCQFSYVASLSKIHMICLITLIESVLSYHLKAWRLPLYE